MKKSNQIYSIIILTLLTTSQIFAAPIFGLAGQGFPSINSLGEVKCDPGWHWCKTTYLAVMNKDLKNVLAFEVSGTDGLTVTLPSEFATNFSKMIRKDEINLTSDVPLDRELSIALSSRLKGADIGNNGILILSKGTYKMKLINGQMTIVNLRWTPIIPKPPKGK